MKVTQITRDALAWRREERRMRKQGYLKSEADQWEIHRGFKQEEVITDVKISVCGKYVYSKTGPRSVSPNT